MRYALRALWLTLVLMMVTADFAFGQSYSMPEICIENINIPEEYFVCDREKCEPEFKRVLDSQGVDFDEWKSTVMIPDDIYLYAMKKNGTMLYIKSEPFTELTFSMYNANDKSEYNEMTKLSYDYKLISDSIAKDNALKKYRYNITSKGVQDEDISHISWVDNGQKDCIPYILCSYKDKDVYIADFHTVFNGCKLSVTLVEYEPISTQKLMLLSDMIVSMTYTEMPDYTQAKIILKEKHEKDLEAKMKVYNEAKNVQFVFGFMIFLMVISAIYIDCRRMMSKRQYDNY